MGTPPEDSDKWKDVSNKFEEHFSEKPERILINVLKSRLFHYTAQLRYCSRNS